MTAEITLAPSEGGTLHRARVLNKDAVGRDRHTQLGFATGWATAAERLGEVARALPG